ncbi:MAG: PD40 domain-containing protein [Candidatus Schekmanbacteria bacterium]|nr:PD40 domain-containing protein [Candidatus Schekmanbacteria bacterium]
MEAHASFPGAAPQAAGWLPQAAGRLPATWIGGGLVLLVAWLCYGDIIGYEITHADTYPAILTGRIRSARDFWDTLSSPFMKDRMLNARYYRPVTSLTFGLSEALGGLDPAYHHGMDLLLHALTAALLYAFLRQLTAPRPPAGFALAAAVLFTAHPIHVENVPSIGYRADLVVALFMMASLVGAAQHLREGGRWALGGSAVACALALGAKESGATIPALVFLLAWFCGNRAGALARARAALATCLPHVAVTLGFVAVRYLVLGRIGGYEFERWPLARRVLGSSWDHVVGLFAPGFSASWEELRARYLWVAVVGVLLVCSLAAVLAARYRGSAANDAPPPVGLFCVTCLVVQLGFHLALTVFFVRYLYVDVLFFAPALIWSLARALPSLRRRTPRARRIAAGAQAFIAAAVVVSLLATSPLFGLHRNGEWRAVGELTARYFTAAAKQLAHVPAGATVYLINTPYTLASELQVPEAPVLLEHSVQAWLDLTFPDRQLRAVGLTYLRDLASNGQGLPVAATLSSCASLSVGVESGGVPLGTPWRDLFGPQNEGKVYQFNGFREGRQLELGFLTPLPEALSWFLIFTGNGVSRRTGSAWTLSAPPPDGDAAGGDAAGDVDPGATARSAPVDSEVRASAAELRAWGNLPETLRGRLVWATNRAGNHELAMLELTSAKRTLTQLTRDPRADTYPRFSPDGTRILFNRSRERCPLTHESAEWDVWMMSADGTGAERLAEHGALPAFADGGRSVVFSRDQAVIRLGLEDRQEEVLVDLAGLGGGDPVGAELWNGLLAMTVRGDRRTFGVLDLASRAFSRLPGEGCEIGWMADSGMVAWVEGRGRGGSSIMSATATGAQRKLLIDLQGRFSTEFFPRASSDGAWLLWGAASTGLDQDRADFEIFAWRFGDSARAVWRLTAHPANDQWPDLHVGLEAEAVAPGRVPAD